MEDVSGKKTLTRTMGLDAGNQQATKAYIHGVTQDVKGVDIGVDLTRRSSDAIKQLGEAIREASLASQQIVAAMRQEVAGIDQVNTVMNEINKVTAQFLTGAQQSLEATESLSGVAGQLQKSAASYTM
jgi:methyl-accepting chemotaxis protein